MAQLSNQKINTKNEKKNHFIDTWEDRYQMRKYLLYQMREVSTTGSNPSIYIQQVLKHGILANANTDEKSIMPFEAKVKGMIKKRKGATINERITKNVQFSYQPTRSHAKFCSY